MLEIRRWILNLSYYITYKIIHKNLDIPLVEDRYTSLNKKLFTNSNLIVRNLWAEYIPDKPPRTLKRRWPRNLLTWNSYWSLLSMLSSFFTCDMSFFFFLYYLRHIYLKCFPASKKLLTHSISKIRTFSARLMPHGNPRRLKRRPLKLE